MQIRKYKRMLTIAVASVMAAFLVFTSSGTETVNAASVDLLEDTNLNVQHTNTGDLVLTTTGTNVAEISIGNKYNVSYAFPPEFSELLNNPRLRENMVLNAEMPSLGFANIVIPVHKTILGSEMTIEDNVVNVPVDRLASVSMGSTSTFSLTIDLDALGYNHLPVSSTCDLSFATTVTDEVLGDGALGGNNTSSYSLPTACTP